MLNVLMGSSRSMRVTICGDQTSALSPLSNLTDRPPPPDPARTAPHERRR
jgi:hypothetical protein